MKIANIGSSFSAGPGILPQVCSEAGRSGANFAHIAAKQLNAELIDLSVSGATLSNMLHESQVAKGHKFPPQIEGIPGDVDTVLVLGGGNDMQYISNIIAETWIGWLALQSLKLINAFSSSQSVPVNERELYQRYGALLDAVHAKAPNARVVVVEYLTVFGSDAKQDSKLPCTNDRVEYHQAAAMSLCRATNEAANERRPWCEVLHVAQPSEAHGLGSQVPWVCGLDFATLRRKEAWAHPNEEGMQAVANMLVEKLAAIR